MSTGWLFVLLGVGAFCFGLGMAAAVFCVGSESHEGRRV